MTFYLRIIILAFALISSAALAETQASSSAQFISLADLHFDPFLSCKAKPCLLIQELREAPVEQWSKLFSRWDTSTLESGKDSNYFILESSLAAAKATALKAKAQFVLVIGDFLAHDFDLKYRKYSGDKSKAGYQAFVKKTLAFLTQEFNRSFPQTDVYFAIGNNDSYQNDYRSTPRGPFFKDFSEQAASLLKNRSQQNRGSLVTQFSQNGYYALNLPQQPGLRLVVLNSVLFSTKARGSGIAQAAQEELDWLHQQLSSAQQKQQHVLLVMHIPSGIDVYRSLYNPFKLVEFWETSYSQRFLKEIQSFSPLIMAVLPAHIHADSFQILTAEHSAIPFSGTPSISPIYGTNPAFKIYTYSTLSLRLTDFATYYYPLNGDKTWKLEYDFNKVYPLKNSEKELGAIMNHLEPKGELAKWYTTYYDINTQSQPISRKWFPYYWCAIHGLTAGEYKACLARS